MHCTKSFTLVKLFLDDRHFPKPKQIVYGWRIKQLYDTLSTLSRHISLANALFHPPERVGTLGYRLATNSFRTEEEGLRSRYIYILPASPRRACGGRQTVGFAERFAAPQRPSAFRVLGPMRSMTKGALRPDKELAYGEQNVRPSAELKPAYGGQ